ncbi:TOBE domain-containing protein [Rhizobium brockwellii]|uniref:TOBE domain-containing protein n=1 Tax=Rhizobium brockwellii TaxID=3019932 RepID=UPI003F9965A4
MKRDGNVEQIGSPLDLYDRPQNLFVASFIGSPGMNFIKGRSNAGRFVSDGDVNVPLPAGISIQDGQEITYGIRPEHLGVEADGLNGEVLLIEPTGGEKQVTVKVGSDLMIASVRERVDLRAGGNVKLSPDLAKVHLFDSASGKRLAPYSVRRRQCERKLKKILAIGEVLVQIVALEKGDRFRSPSNRVGPFQPGTPAIFIDQGAEFAQPCALISSRR